MLSSDFEDRFQQLLAPPSVTPPAEAGYGTQVARGLISGATFGALHPYANAGPGGLPEGLSYLAGAGLGFIPLARGAGMGVAALGKLAPRLLAEGVPAAQAVSRLATGLRPWESLSGSGRLLAMGGAGAAATELPEAFGSEPRTPLQRLGGAALGFGLGAAGEGLLGQIGARREALRAAVEGSATPSVGQRAIQVGFDTPLAQEYGATIAKLQDRLTTLQSKIPELKVQATDVEASPLYRRDARKLLRRQQKEIESTQAQIDALTERMRKMNVDVTGQGILPLSGSVPLQSYPDRFGRKFVGLIQQPTEGSQAQAAATEAGQMSLPFEQGFPPSPPAFSKIRPEIQAMSPQDLKSQLAVRGIPATNMTPDRMREVLNEYFTREGMQLSGQNPSTFYTPSEFESTVTQTSPTYRGTLYRDPTTGRVVTTPEKALLSPPGLTPLDPDRFYIANPNQWLPRMRALLRGEPTGIDPVPLKNGIMLIRNAKANIIPAGTQAAARLVDNSVFPDITNMVC